MSNAAKRCDHRDGQAHADLVSKKRDGDGENSLNQLAPSILADSYRAGSIFRHAGQQQDGAESQQHPDADDTDSRKRPVEVAKPGAGDRTEADELRESG